MLSQDIYIKLGLNKTNGLFFTKENLWKSETNFPNRIKRLIDKKIEPDAFFCFDNKPLILFFHEPLNKEELHKAIWNFNECPIVIIIEKNSVEIFNGFQLDVKTALLKKIGGNEKLNDFSYFGLVTGKTWEQYQNDLDYKNRIDHNLLQNIKAARDVLHKSLKLESKVTNALIGKVIFVRYLIDRKVKMKYDEKLRIWSNDEFCDLLNDPISAQSFFEYLEDDERGFNGDLFPLSDTEYGSIKQKHYNIMRKLLLGHEISTGQRSLFQLYDFSIIPIEFISNIYELFIGRDNQEKEGAYYTPLFLVDYILRETIEKHLNNNDVRNTRLAEIKTSNSGTLDYCKTLDPACGSGIFLVETLRKIIEKYIEETGIDIKSSRFKTAIKNLAQTNIYGIDKDISAVQVAVFSIYLTLLDYLEPPGIETFQFPNLFNANFFVSDFFDETNIFNKEFESLKFDFILGNPPWMRGKGEKKTPSYVRYINDRRKRELVKKSPSIEIGNREIAQAFLLRSSDFCTHNTICALIVTSKVLYNIQSVNFRSYFLHNFFLNKVFELAAVRKEVFYKSNDSAVAPPCILFFRYADGKDTSSNIIEHIALKPSRFFSLFKIFTIGRCDYKTVIQGKLKEFDWLWKILVYGSYLDFNLIKRLKENYSNIHESILSDKHILIGQGVMVGGGDKNDASNLVGKKFIDTRRDITQYWINPTNNKTWEYNTVHRIRNEKLYEAPVLLITAGVRNDLKSVSAISYYDAVYKSSLTGIKGNKKSEKTLRQIAGIINSSFFSYYNLMTFSSSGIEREESHDDEKLNVPVPTENNIDILVRDLEKLMLTNYSPETILFDPLLNSTIENKLLQIDSNIYTSFSLSEEEKDLLDYANNNIIPIIMRQKNYEKLFKPLKYQSADLNSYAQLFIDRFRRSLESSGKKFISEVWHTNNIIGLFFKIIPTYQYKEDVVWLNKQNDNSGILSLLSKISSEKITDKLFIQKDIRGFDKNSFYIFKPNEQRLWHKAIGHLDVNEFADAMIKEAKSTNNV